MESCIQKKITNNFGENDLKEFIVVIWRRRIMLSFIFLFFLVISSIYVLIGIPKVYSSSIVVSPGNFENNAITDVNTARLFVLNDSFLSKVYKEANITSSSGVKEGIKVEGVKDTKFIKITVANKDPDMATKVASKIALLCVTQNESGYQKQCALINEQIDVGKARLQEYNEEIEKSKQLLTNIDNTGMVSLEKDLWRMRLLDMLKYLEDKRTILEERNFTLEKQIQSIKNTQIAKSEDNPAVLVNSGRKAPIVFVSGLAGIIIGLFMAFLLEYLKVNSLKSFLKTFSDRGFEK